MTNHLHLLVQAATQPLGRVMQRIAVRYSRYRHRELHTTGHLFEQRYGAKLVSVDEYLLTLIRYIHLNPVKARIVTGPADYPWSSHRAYLGMEAIPWLTTEFALSLFASRLDHARARYRRFVEASNDDDDVDPHRDCYPKDSRILGSDRFVETLPVIPNRPRSTLSLEELAAQVCERYGIEIAMLRSLSRERYLTPARIELIKQALELRIATLSDIARFLHRDPSALTKLLSRHAAIHRRPS